MARRTLSVIAAIIALCLVASGCGSKSKSPVKIVTIDDTISLQIGSGGDVPPTQNTVYIMGSQGVVKINVAGINYCEDHNITFGPVSMTDAHGVVLPVLKFKGKYDWIGECMNSSSGSALYTLVPGIYQMNIDDSLTNYWLQVVKQGDKPKPFPVLSGEVAGGITPTEPSASAAPSASAEPSASAAPNDGLVAVEHPIPIPPGYSKYCPTHEVFCIASENGDDKAYRYKGKYYVHKDTDQFFTIDVIDAPGASVHDMAKEKACEGFANFFRYNSNPGVRDDIINHDIVSGYCVLHEGNIYSVRWFGTTTTPWGLMFTLSFTS